jgi:two-component system cell cycle sensor histidine kinase PleC
LNAIIGFSEMIKLEYLGPLGNYRYIEYTENIYASGRELWEDFLDMIEIARIKKGKRELNAEIVDVQQVLQDILQQSEQKTVKITWKPSVVRLPNIYLDPHLLRTMLSNIIHGAVMSNSSSDTVLISTELSDGLTFVAEAPFIRSPSYLGFTLTKVIAEWHGGHFSVDTTPNVGITVRLSFPPERVMIRRATITR